MQSTEAKAKPRPNVRESYLVTESGCWDWTGYIDRGGYGKAYDPNLPVRHRMDWAHRVSYRHHKGEIPARFDVDHVCENTRCINPDHLEVVSRSEHVARTMRRAGKWITQESAAHLRRSGLTYGEIAEALGIAGKESAHRAVQAAIRNGLVAAEEVPPTPYLTEQDRDDIRTLCALGVPQTEVGAWYKVDSSQVSRISRGITSGHGGSTA